MELRGINAISKWRELLGPIDSAVAREKDPNLLRAKYGENDIKNGLHGADSVEAVSRVSGLNVKLKKKFTFYA